MTYKNIVPFNVKFKINPVNECCLFYENDHKLINLTINGVMIRSKLAINILGVLFDSNINKGKENFTCNQDQVVIAQW